MSTYYIGLIVGVRTNTVYSVVNLEDDAELDNPCHLQLKNIKNEPVKMIKVRRENYGFMGAMSLEDVHMLVTQWYVRTSEVYHGPDILDGAI